ncbi:Protein of unknown function [Gryllus bimaculatus]|nr:Protein of unknown function [Gryllus bimaculatus]
MDMQLAGSRDVTAAPRIRQEGEEEREKEEDRRGERAKAKRRRATSRALRAVAREEFGPSGWMVVNRLSRLPVVRCGARAYRRAKASPVLGGPLAAAEACLGEAASRVADAAAPFLVGQGVSAFVTDRFLCKVLELAVSVCPCIASPPSQICGEISTCFSTSTHRCPRTAGNKIRRMNSRQTNG